MKNNNLLRILGFAGVLLVLGGVIFGLLKHSDTN